MKDLSHSITNKQVFTAKTVEEARNLAVQTFGVEESRICFTVLEEPKRGFLGFGLKGEARVEAFYEKNKKEIALEYVRGIMDSMGIQGAVTAQDTENGCVIEIGGDEVGAIIGRRGETLDAIQYLASMAANKSDKDYFRICVDSNGYREKRRVTLEQLAVKIAKSVARSGRSSSLEPMNPYDRRIIHSAVAGVEGVASKSVGEEPYRRVVISSTAPQRAAQGGGTGASGRGPGKGGRRPAPGPKGGRRASGEDRKPRNPGPNPGASSKEKTTSARGTGDSSAFSEGKLSREREEERRGRTVNLETSFERDYKKTLTRTQANAVKKLKEEILDQDTEFEGDYPILKDIVPRGTSSSGDQEKQDSPALPPRKPKPEEELGLMEDDYGKIE